MSDEDLVRRLRDMLHELATPVDVGELHPEGRPLWPEEKDSVWDEALVAEAADAIERLTRERDDCREDYLRESKIAAGYAGALFRAERKVEKLRGLLKEILEFVDDPYDEIAIYIGNALAETEKGDDGRAAAAFAETEECK